MVAVAYQHGSPVLGCNTQHPRPAIARLNRFLYTFNADCAMLETVHDVSMEVRNLLAFLRYPPIYFPLGINTVGFHSLFTSYPFSFHQISCQFESTIMTVPSSAQFDSEFKRIIENVSFETT